MKILIVGGDFRSNTRITGYVTALRHITSEIAKCADVFVVPVYPAKPQFTKEVVWDGAIILSKRPQFSTLLKTVLGLIPGMLRIKRYLNMYRDRGFVPYLLTVIKYSAMYAYNRVLFETAITECDPQVVNIHGMSILTLPYHDVMMQTMVPYVSSAHGLFSPDPNSFKECDDALEGDLFKAVDERGYPITVVSKKVGERAVKLFSLNPKNVKVVTNGVENSPCGKKDKNALRKKYGLPTDKKIIISVGTVETRKNQTAVLHALASMSSEERLRIIYLVVGGGETEKLIEESKRVGVKESLVTAGRVSDEQKAEYYSLSDIFILTSTSEGFGLVFLEAIAEGLPIVTFSDLDAVEELYDSTYMILAEERSASCLASAILKAIHSEWDSDTIRTRAQEWDWSRVCQRYMSVFDDLVMK